MTPSADLELLRKRITVPDAFTQGTWLQRPLGTSTLNMGPSQSQLLVWLPLATADDPGWTAAGSVRSPTSRTIPADVAEQLLPPAVLGSCGISADQATIAGPEYATTAFETVFWKYGWAIALPTGLVLSLTRG